MQFARRLARARSTVLTGVLMVGLAVSVLAQRGGYMARTDNPRYDGRFMFARLKYTVGPGGYYYMNEPAWAHGYPSAEDNMMKIMNAITDLNPHVETGVVLALDDPELGKFPVSYMTEAGFWEMTDKEALAFRAYLQKGGFVIFDDFRDGRRGGNGWGQFDFNMQRVIPGAQFVEMKTTDPIFHSFFEINSLDIVPQYYDQGRPVFLGLYEDNDPKKRLMAIINFNTDISNYWEYSGQGFRPIDDTNEAYKLGVNYIIYGLTH